MRRAFFCWLLWSVVCRAQADPLAEVDQRTRSFLLETIPKLDIDQLPLKEALGVIRHEWERHHPQETFPVGLSETIAPDGNIPKLAVTLKFVNIPFAEAVRFLGNQVGKVMVQHQGLYSLQNPAPHDDDCGDWVIRDYAFTSQALSTLAITKSASPADVQRALSSLGIAAAVERVDEKTGAAIGWVPDQSRIIVRATRDVQDQIKAIILLLNGGYKIVKPSPETDGK